MADKALLMSGNRAKATAPTVLPCKPFKAASGDTLLKSGTNGKASAPTVIKAPKPRAGNGVAGPTKS